MVVWGTSGHEGLFGFPGITIVIGVRCCNDSTVPQLWGPGDGRSTGNCLDFLDPPSTAKAIIFVGSLYILFYMGLWKKETTRR